MRGGFLTYLQCHTFLTSYWRLTKFPSPHLNCPSATPNPQRHTKKSKFFVALKTLGVALRKISRALRANKVIETPIRKFSARPCTKGSLHGHSLDDLFQQLLSRPVCVQCRTNGYTHRFCSCLLALFVVRWKPQTDKSSWN